jgi:YspA, cpYpsA-related SLOG family
MTAALLRTQEDWLRAFEDDLCWPGPPVPHTSGTPYRILVTGSRGWDLEQELRFALISAAVPHLPWILLVHGACPDGADALAAAWASHYGVRTEPHPAQWSEFGKAAGFRRNAEMAALGAGICLGFAMPCTDPRCDRPEPHDTHGTEDCLKRARAARIPVRRYLPDGTVTL